MLVSRAITRIEKELEQLRVNPGPGISVAEIGDDIAKLGAIITGPEDSPYSGGLFSLKVEIPSNYPFEPPVVQFTTPVYHPNIDRDGRICLDTLKPQPQGSWSPSVNINTLLLSIRLLLAHPNAEDGLVPDITEEYRRSYATYRSKAVEFTRLHAIPVTSASATSSPTVVEERSNTENVTAGRKEAKFVMVDTSSHSPCSGRREKGTAVQRVSYEAEGYVLLGCHPRAVDHLREILGVASAGHSIEPVVASVPTICQPQERDSDDNHCADYYGSPEKKSRLV